MTDRENAPISEQTPETVTAPAPTRRRKAGFGLGLASFIISILTIPESSFPVACKWILALEKGYFTNKAGPGTTVIFDTSLADALAQGTIYMVIALGVIAIGLGIGGMIAYFVSKNKRGNTVTLVFSIIGIVFGLFGIIGINAMTALAATLTF